MAPSDLEMQIAEIQAVLSARCEELGAIVGETVWQDVEVYAACGRISREEVVANCADNIRFVLQGFDGRTAFDTEPAVRAGMDRAAAGVPLTAVMEAYRIGCHLLWDELVAMAAARSHIGREALIRATGRIWMAQDVFTHAMATGYREEITRKTLTDATERAALVEALIEGRLIRQANLWEVASILRLPARGPYVAVTAECPAIGRSALPGIEARLNGLGISSAWRLLPDIQVGLVHVQTDSTCELLRRTLSRAATTRVGISARFDDLGQTPDAVTYARIALSADRSDGSLVGVFEAEPLTIAAISAPGVMKQIASATFAGFADLSDADRAALFATFRAWVAAGGSIGKAAKGLYCHPNTVRHRLRRIESRTGKSISRPRDLAELCLAFEVDRQLPESGL